MSSKSVINIGVKEILHGISTMETKDLELFFKEVGSILARRKNNVLPKKESDLFLVINQPSLNDEETKRADYLYEKLQAESISEAEQSELRKYIQRQEAFRVKRLQALIELSQIRNVSLDQLMKDLGINNLAHNEQTKTDS